MAKKIKEKVIDIDPSRFEEMTADEAYHVLHTMYPQYEISVNTSRNSHGAAVAIYVSREIFDFQNAIVEFVSYEKENAIEKTVDEIIKRMESIKESTGDK